VKSQLSTFSKAYTKLCVFDKCRPNYTITKRQSVWSAPAKFCWILYTLV